MWVTTACSTISKADKTKEKNNATSIRQAAGTRFWYEKMKRSPASQQLFQAAVKGDTRLATDAAGRLGDPNCCNPLGYRSLQLAIACGNIELLDLLLKSSADINVHAKGAPPPIVLAASSGDVQVFHMLLEHGANLSATDKLIGESALTRAATRGHHGVVYAALEHPSAPGYRKLIVNYARHDGRTALHIAAAGGHRAVCDVLLGANAEPNVGDDSGRSPLHFAVSGNHVETANVLMSGGAGPSLGDKHGETPLHLACAEGMMVMADVLARFSADINIQRDDGRAPLHLAARGGFDAITKLLLSQNATANVADTNGETPFTLAFAEGYIKSCRALVEAGAEVHAVSTSVGWVPPYTELDPPEHDSIRRQKANESESYEMFGCV